MFQINESFLEGLGLESMNEDDKKNFLEYVQDQMELRIGERISSDMDNEKQDEFAKLADGDEAITNEVMMRYPHFEDDEVYTSILDSSDGNKEIATNQYATLKWLEENCPNYQEVVRKTIDEIRKEIKDNKDQILAA
ncbi:hypothetical protein IIY59_00560 [Candidatus Saccharibacteria bacterium]|nr:hypothetical protein [Candidatus Saccharibacteria bacterium]